MFNVDTKITLSNNVTNNNEKTFERENVDIKNKNNDIINIKNIFIKDKKNDKELKTFLKEINNIPNFLKNNIVFNYNSEAEVFIVKVKNKETEEVISQFPSDDFIKKIKNNKISTEYSFGFLLDLKG